MSIHFTQPKLVCDVLWYVVSLHFWIYNYVVTHTNIVIS